jgi:hypothetical protein
MKERSATVQVSGNIPPEDYERWKRTGMRLAHVIRMGLMAAEQAPGYISRIRELEAGNEKLQRHVTFLYNQVNTLKAEKA